MILRSVHAENILKYRRLALVDLPASGQIAVAGHNEAGKTAIGETICFALFGRTFSLGPEQITRVIRWGEFQGAVRVVFSGSDGVDYQIERRMDNNGRHEARLAREGATQPLAQGAPAVEEAVRELVGFDYRSFIDSFYLAQREMEVPHAKSATVKALIGVDKLETVAGQLQGEIGATAKAVQSLEGEVAATTRQVAEIGLERAHLGRLEAKREEAVREAARLEGEAKDLEARAAHVGKAGEMFAHAVETFTATSLRTKYQQWRERRKSVEAGLVAATRAGQGSDVQLDAEALDTAGAAIHAFDAGLAEYDKIRDLAGLYRQRLTGLLDESSRPDAKVRTRSESSGSPGRGGDATPLAEKWDARREPRTEQGRADRGRLSPSDQSDGDARFADRMAAVLARAERIRGRRRPVLGFTVFFAEMAALAWACWVVLLAAPTSTVGGWLSTVFRMGPLGQQLILLFSALCATGLAVALFVAYRRATGQLRVCELEQENIEAAARAARDELGVLEALEEVAVPDALQALSGVRNSLLHSAVVKFAEGDGAVLVKPDALAEKLRQIRSGGDAAARSLCASRERLTQRAEERQAEAAQVQQQIEALEQQVSAEKARWEKVEALERRVAALQSKLDGLRQEIRVRKLGLDLIDGATRRIYERFHPELRRFVSKILPHLTLERYQHLELDDDLRVRVFCNEKNDFVGLAEISNGTHRQLMLCVRLALSQALIASSSKAAQFIFFDEPFAFFDQRRMARAIDVLGKISPQITQVFLAAQQFEDPERFDLVIDCDVESDCLTVGGRAGVQAAAAAT